MKKTYQKLVALFAVLMVAMFAFTACGSNDVESEAEATEPTVTSGTVTSSVDMSSYEAGKTVRLWLPVAQSNDDQEITDVDYSAEGATKAELTTDDAGNNMLYVEWDSAVAPEDRKVELSFHATRTEALRPEINEDGDIPEDMEQYLLATDEFAVDGEVKKLADEITDGKESTEEKARAIYDWIIANLNRDESVVGCGTGEFDKVIAQGGGKCTDLNSVFVALCRASGIPAREMFGIRMNDTDITGNQHCWAQFYVAGTGWVYADPADVLKAILKNEWEKDSDEAKESQEYYWGQVDSERVELSQGRDLTLNPAQDAGTLNNFGYPYAEVDGTKVDCYAPDQFVYTYSFAADE